MPIKKRHEPTVRLIEQVTGQSIGYGSFSKFAKLLGDAANKELHRRYISIWLHGNGIPRRWLEHAEELSKNAGTGEIMTVEDIRPDLFKNKPRRVAGKKHIPTVQLIEQVTKKPLGNGSFPKFAKLLGDVAGRNFTRGTVSAWVNGVGIPQRLLMQAEELSKKIAGKKNYMSAKKIRPDLFKQIGDS
jgi:hypothetical protein